VQFQVTNAMAAANWSCSQEARAWDELLVLMCWPNKRDSASEAIPGQPCNEALAAIASPTVIADATAANMASADL